MSSASHTARCDAGRMHVSRMTDASPVALLGVYLSIERAASGPSAPAGSSMAKMLLPSSVTCWPAGGCTAETARREVGEVGVDTGHDRADLAVDAALAGRIRHREDPVGRRLDHLGADAAAVAHRRPGGVMPTATPPSVATRALQFQPPARSIGRRPGLSAVARELRLSGRASRWISRARRQVRDGSGDVPKSVLHATTDTVVSSVVRASVVGVVDVADGFVGTVVVNSPEPAGGVERRCDRADRRERDRHGRRDRNRGNHERACRSDAHRRRCGCAWNRARVGRGVEGGAVVAQLLFDSHSEFSPSSRRSDSSPRRT